MVCKRRGIYGFLGPSWVLITYNICPPVIVDKTEFFTSRLSLLSVKLMHKTGHFASLLSIHLTIDIVYIDALCSMDDRSLSSPKGWMRKKRRQTSTGMCSGRACRRRRSTVSLSGGFPTATAGELSWQGRTCAHTCRTGDRFHTFYKSRFCRGRLIPDLYDI